MWNRMKRQGDECDRFRTLLEDSVVVRPGSGSVEELLEAMTPIARSHFVACLDCQEATQDLLAAREILKEAIPKGFEPGPWFAGRVLAAVAVREKEFQEAARTWVVVPRLASRLALASGALLLVAGTWLYERPAPEKINQPAAVATPEYLFEAPPPPMNQDDVLISMAERNP
jgi:hypothetical protein